MPGMSAEEHMKHMSGIVLNQLVAKAEAENLAFPVLVSPPGGARRPGLESDAEWTVRSDAQNRPLRTTIKYDAMTGDELSRESFADKHVIDQVVAYGIAWHEGQLFGWVNQLIGVATALALLTLSVSGFVMWRQRKPDGSLGAPQRPPVRLKGKGVQMIVAIFFILLPLFAFSIVVLWLFEKLVLPRLPALARWLGAEERPGEFAPAE